MTYKIAIVGEAWGADEERFRMPFVGASGNELTRMLKEAGIDRSQCFLTNVFNLRPKNNDITTLCTDKANGITGRGPLAAGKYLRPEYAGELSRLARELRSNAPNVIIATGNTPNWFLGAIGGISKIRGAAYASPFGKTLPTYHPAAILRDWSLRPVTVLDFQKAARESLFPNLRRPRRTVLIPESINDLEDFYATYLIKAEELSVDIETRRTEITCLGIAPSISEALVIPFTDPRASSGSYWKSIEEELFAWRFIRKVLGSPVPKVFQNGLYDIHFLWKSYGIAVNNCADDTMLLHHSLYPESQKGLGFLGSVYTNEASWKMMRTRGKETIKKDE